MHERTKRGIKNCPDSSLFKDCIPLQLLCNLIGNRPQSATLQMIGGVPTWTGGTPPPPNVTNPTTGDILIDRNLGASQVATSSTDADAYGDLYQWGRGTDGHQIRTSGTTSTLSSTDDWYLIQGNK